MIQMDSLDTHNCADWQRQLAVYRPGEDLPASLRRHLETCRGCQAAFEMDRQILSSFLAMHAPSASPGFAWRVEQRRRAEELAPLKARIATWLRAFYPMRELAWVITLGFVGICLGAWVGTKLVEARPVERLHRVHLSESYAHAFDLAPPYSLAGSHPAREHR
jgi:hypothetical protein